METLFIGKFPAMKKRIYLDYQATTPVDSRVFEVMKSHFCEQFGNPASRHEFGWEAENAIAAARKQTAYLIGAGAKEIIFTSGATESINLALKGIAEAYSGKHIITAMTEHKAVFDVCKTLEKRGFEITFLKPNRDGQISPKQVEEAVREDTFLISLMHANNEIGTIYPVAEFGKIAHKNDIIFHVDAAQTVGKIPVNVANMNVDLLSFSGHKIYAPKGVGALFVRRKNPRIRLAPQIHGGGHERGLRSGTLNVPGVIGLGKACEICAVEMQTEATRIAKLRKQLLDGILSNMEGVTINGTMENRLDGNLNLTFYGVDSETLILSMKEIAVSSGSACTSADIEPSHVLKALGLSNLQARSSLRLSIGRMTTADEIDFVTQQIENAVNRLRHRKH